MLRIKGLSQRLSRFFPFDIINFDTYGNVLNHDKDSNRLLYLAFERIFHLQQSTSSFLLFITLPISDIDSSFQSRFRNNFDANVEQFPKIRNSLIRTVKTTSFDEIDENSKLSLAIAKSVILPTAKDAGWNCEHKGVCIYENKDLRKMLSAVVLLSKAKSNPDNFSYLQDVIRIVQNMPFYYSYEESLRNKDAIDHLNKIKKYRDGLKTETKMS